MNLINSLKSVATVVVHTAKRKSPEILMAAGVVSFVATVVTASKETVAAQDILDEFRENRQAIKECKEEVGEADYPVEVYRHDVIVTYSKFGLGLVKNYLPALGFGALTIVCFFGAYGILKKRNAALVAAYTALNSAFMKYRQRVIEDKGEDADTYYMTGQKPKKITEKDEDGNKIESKVVKGDEVDPALRYMFKFGKYKENGELNHQWTDNKNYNRMRLEGVMDYLTDMLYCRTTFDSNHNIIRPGYVFLNETRSACGEDYNSDGQIVGNLYSEGKPGCNGYINLNIVEGTEIDPDTGKEIDCYWINPNVDGPIWDLLDNYEKDRKGSKRKRAIEIKNFKKHVSKIEDDPNLVVQTF